MRISKVYRWLEKIRAKIYDEVAKLHLITTTVDRYKPVITKSAELSEYNEDKSYYEMKLILHILKVKPVRRGNVGTDLHLWFLNNIFSYWNILNVRVNVVTQSWCVYVTDNVKHHVGNFPVVVNELRSYKLLTEKDYVQSRI